MVYVTCRFDRQRQKKVTDFEQHHHVYVEEWGHFQDHVDDNDEAHSNEHFRRYLVWYQRATRSKLKGQCTQEYSSGISGVFCRVMVDAAMV